MPARGPHSSPGVERRLAFGVLFSGAQTVPRAMALAGLAERLGFEFGWFADEKFFHDPFVTMTAVAAVTTRMALGTGVTDPYSRHPALTAMALATLAEFAPGRVIMGIGAGGSGFPQMGIQRLRPAAAVREAIALMRRLWAGETASSPGLAVEFRSGRLSIAPPRPPIPMFIAARGRHMLRLAGEIADGAIIAPYASPPGLRYALNLIAAGAARAGRTVNEIETVARVDVCIAPDRQRALAASKRWIALPLWSSFPNWDYLEPLPNLVVPEEVRSILASRDYSRIEEAAEFIPDEFADHLVVAGTVEQVIAQVRAIAESGISQITIHPVPLAGQTEEDLLEQFARRVMPHVWDTRGMN